MPDGVIEQFVRTVLGCSCPAAVFRAVTLENDPPAFAGLAPVRLLRIGGRLLVLLLEAGERDVPALPLEQLLARGRQLRDAESCNRFRLVVAVPAPEAVQGPLAERFARFGGRDERLHLHVVSTDRLPNALRSPLQQGMQQ